MRTSVVIALLVGLKTQLESRIGDGEELAVVFRRELELIDALEDEVLKVVLNLDEL